MTGITVRRLAEADVAEAERINRLAFATFFGAPDPTAFRTDFAVVRGRRHANPDGVFAAELDGRLVGSGVLGDWGSLCVLGPLTILPEHWGKGIGRRLMEVLVDEIDRRGHRFSGLFTHAHSPTHIRLYESFGFWMDMTSGMMSKPVAGAALPAGAVRLSALTGDARDAAIAACREISETVSPGLDPGREIRTVAELAIGDTVLLRRDGAVAGFVVGQHGTGTEGGSAGFRVKFGAVRPGAGAADEFVRLLAACEGLAAELGAARIAAGTSSGRFPAYRIMQEAGYRTDMNGVIMLRPQGTGYNRPDVFVMDDWR